MTSGCPIVLHNNYYSSHQEFLFPPLQLPLLPNSVKVSPSLGPAPPQLGWGLLSMLPEHPPCAVLYHTALPRPTPQGCGDF